MVVVLGQLRLRVKRDEVLPLARDDDAGGGPAQPLKRPSSLSQLQVRGTTVDAGEALIVVLIRPPNLSCTM